jgi:hypothetical protein
MALHKTISLILLIILLFGCNSEYKNLEKYYKTNPALHKEISDSLVAFCKKYKTHVTLQRAIDGRRSFSFSIYNDSDNTNYRIIFDSLFTRNDPYPNQTQHFQIPIKIMNLFKQITYTRIRSDSSNTFFGGPWHVKFQLGTQGDVQYGILISNEMNSCEGCYKKLASNTWLTEGTIP